MPKTIDRSTRIDCLPRDLLAMLQNSRNCKLAGNIDELLEMEGMGTTRDWFDVTYSVPCVGLASEARVCRVRNGIAVNFQDPYMRRRDPDCLYIADEKPSDKPSFRATFGEEFSGLREQTLEWLRSQDLIAFFFRAGSQNNGLDAIVIAPANAAFFAFGLALLQGILDPDCLPTDFSVRAVIYVAPPFRHTHFSRKQVVVHNRMDELYEMFSYNLYPGPSAKKGVYGMLIDLGESEDWVAMHCSAVQVITPYDNKVNFTHEGASGSGKSEMLEYLHREQDGKLLLGKNTLSGEERHIVLPRTCKLRPIADDMALSPPSIQRNSGKLYIQDAEDAWFVRVNHITRYGTDPHLERSTIHPPSPLLFLNIDATPGGSALIWEHIEDEPGVLCPNPRVILPRHAVPDVLHGPVAVDVRSFGVRTPPCTQANPTYGIVGLFHILPPALAWLWRLVAPRGDANPSIVQSEGMATEGVGSYWPFATGRKVNQANLLLHQIEKTPKVRYILCPNQHVGAWKVGFMPQWLTREYLARRGGAKFSREQVMPARCSLLGDTPKTITVEGQTIGHWFLQVETQPEVQIAGYDAGAAILTQFFHEHLKSFWHEDLTPLGRTIIDCCLSGGTAHDYDRLIASDPIISDE